MIISIVILIILILILIINFYMIVRTKNKILTSEKLKDEDGIDCILVLGAGVKNNKN